MTNAALRGKPDAGNPHVRFDEGEVALAATPRRGSLLYKPMRNDSAIVGLRTVRRKAALAANGRCCLSSIIVACAVLAALSTAQTAKAVDVVGDANAETTISPSNTIIKMTQSGTLTVTEPGEIEILLVAGGGGAGATYSQLHGGGGGGGGVVHIRNLSVSVGEYPIVIGAGGAVNGGGKPLGGSTTGFDYTAIGGGPGARADAPSADHHVSNLGASGGGGSKGWSTTIPGGTAKAYANNLGHDGADAASQYTSGGGGGAGTAGNGVAGGDGYLCDITGEAIYYAGGGGGGRGYNAPGPNGQGGGRGNYGGGGRAAGDSYPTTPEAGGPGVAIVRFARRPAKNETIFDDATGGMVTTCRVDGVKYQVHTFAQSGQFAIPHHGHVEVLVVGGGGGGGANVTRSGETSHNGSNVFYGGGGGAGGVVHKGDLFLTNGVYDIVVGAGGVVNNTVRQRGGDTTAFGLTAFGGGCGAKGYALMTALSGASGGGGAQSYWQGAGNGAKGAEPVAAYTNAPYFNIGNKGGNARDDAGTGGGGGGAGGAASGVNGGAAYVCSITGADVAYAGGGGGYYYGVYSVPGGGSGSYGGGGNSNAVGGPGVVIVRHQLPETYGMVIILR